jgi:hypothetical protein
MSLPTAHTMAATRRTTGSFAVSPPTTSAPASPRTGSRWAGLESEGILTTGGSVRTDGGWPIGGVAARLTISPRRVIPPRSPALFAGRAFGLGAERSLVQISRPDRPLCASPHPYAGFAPFRGRSGATRRTARNRTLCTNLCTTRGRTYARPALGQRSGYGLAVEAGLASPGLASLLAEIRRDLPP